MEYFTEGNEFIEVRVNQVHDPQLLERGTLTPV
jgi:hypothetical protein